MSFTHFKLSFTHFRSEFYEIKIFIFAGADIFHEALCFFRSEQKPQKILIKIPNLTRPKVKIMNSEKKFSVRNVEYSRTGEEKRPLKKFCSSTAKLAMPSAWFTHFIHYKTGLVRTIYPPAAPTSTRYLLSTAISTATGQLSFEKNLVSTILDYVGASCESTAFYRRFFMLHCLNELMIECAQVPYQRDACLCKWENFDCKQCRPQKPSAALYLYRCLEVRFTTLPTPDTTCARLYDPYGREFKVADKVYFFQCGNPVNIMQHNFRSTSETHATAGGGFSPVQCQDTRCRPYALRRCAGCAEGVRGMLVHNQDLPRPNAEGDIEEAGNAFVIRNKPWLPIEFYNLGTTDELPNDELKALYSSIIRYGTYERLDGFEGPIHRDDWDNDFGDHLNYDDEWNHEDPREYAFRRYGGIDEGDN